MLTKINNHRYHRKDEHRKKEGTQKLFNDVSVDYSQKVPHSFYGCCTLDFYLIFELILLDAHKSKMFFNIISLSTLLYKQPFDFDI
jgi:hypothetical protein